MDAIFISVAANGHSTPHLDHVYVSFYGPKGGTRGTETITLESARKLRDELFAKLPYDHASDTVDVLTQAESFISGFEDDPTQIGIADMLAGLRAAIQREQARPDVQSQPSAPTDPNRPGDRAGIYANEKGVDYATALVLCKVD